jgi:hypothetical protein
MPSGASGVSRAVVGSISPLLLFASPFIKTARKYRYLRYYLTFYSTPRTLWIGIGLWLLGIALLIATESQRHVEVVRHPNYVVTYRYFQMWDVVSLPLIGVGAIVWMTALHFKALRWRKRLTRRVRRFFFASLPPRYTQTAREVLRRANNP